MMDKSLNLIPGSGKEFSSGEYWNKFFKIRGTQAFEWYGEYEHLCECIHKYCKSADQILMVGCGNSKLSENMYDVFFKNITNIDLSDVVIKQMSVKNKSRAEMKYLKMDMLQMDFEAGQFDVVVDKGTLDALMSDENAQKANENSERLFNEIDRVLKVGGRYMCISLAQEHIASRLLQTFAEKGWFARIHRLSEQDLDFHLPVFVFVFTKMKLKLSSANPMIEIKFDLNDDKFQRVGSIEDARAKIKEFQNYGLIKFCITNKNVDAKDDVFVHLYDDKINSKYPRFTIYIVDYNHQTSKARMNGLFAAFVVPIGKEIEWLFGTRPGREELTMQAKYQRLAIVHLNRAHTYESLDTILKELSPKIMELAPKGIPASYKIPMLSLGADVDVRNLRFKGTSPMSGEYFIEDVLSNELMEPTRRLIFHNIIPTIQTEVLLREKDAKSGGASKGRKKAAASDSSVLTSTLEPNYDNFIEDYFSMILSQLVSLKLKPDQPLNILILGLGGGVMVAYCRNWLKNCNIDAVEIDDCIANVARDWFGVKEDDKLRVHIADGLKFIEEAAEKGKKWDIVIVDINNSDTESDLWVPTKEFLDEEFLKKCHKILDTSIGLFVMNMLCNDKQLRRTLLEKVQRTWPHIQINKLSKNRNEILFCSDNKSSDLYNKNAFKLPTSKDQKLPDQRKGLEMLEEVSASLVDLKLD